MHLVQDLEKLKDENLWELGELQILGLPHDNQAGQRSGKVCVSCHSAWCSKLSFRVQQLLLHLCLPNLCEFLLWPVLTYNYTEKGSIIPALVV